jgi:hypothetical protein
MGSIPVFSTLAEKAFFSGWGLSGDGLNQKSEVATRAAPKAVGSKEDKIFSHSLLCCHRPTWLNSNKGTKCDIEIRAARTFAGGGRVCSL